MVGALFDTNILIDFLAKVPQAREELDRYGKRAISIVTWIEILVGTDPHLEVETRAFASSRSSILTRTSRNELWLCGDVIG